MLCGGIALLYPSPKSETGLGKVQIYRGDRYFTPPKNSKGVGREIAFRENATPPPPPEAQLEKMGVNYRFGESATLHSSKLEKGLRGKVEVYEGVQLYLSAKLARNIVIF